MVVREAFYGSVLILLGLSVTAGISKGRDPVSLTLDELFEKSDAVIVGRVLKVERTAEFKDLDSTYFDECCVTIEVLSALKGEPKRKDKITVVAYESNGLGMPGNFGSEMKLFDKTPERLHLLYLKKRKSSWMPTTGYLDGGNSHFVIKSSGFTE